MADASSLADRCLKVAELSHDALDWISDPENAEMVDRRAKTLTQLMRKSRRRANKLANSARTRMSVSVFGPSQAGKSFLVSVLARPADGRLVADFNGPGGKLDYIREINPEGEGESTGLVTRFTMSKEPTPEGFPIKLQLLSEADLARTIANSFFNDGDQSEPTPEPEDLAAHFDAFRGRVGSAPVPGLSEDEIYEIGDYFATTFVKAAYAAALRTFWEEAAEMAPKMAVADRAKFLSILWGGHEPLTALYLQLAEALQKVGHAQEVFAGLDALTPRETSIIDVKTLHGLFGGGDTDLLRLRTPDGREVDVPRSVVCALAAELVFPMETQPSPLFAETDLLDFPGARNRFEQPLSKTLAKPEETVSQLLLRGKVAYLFDRYVENQEITSMLLCVPDSNMDTLDLPGLVENWIALTHGARPQQRAETDCILFFVMTKFDKHLGESAAGGGESSRFQLRMKASLLDGFGGKIDDSWVNQWTPNTPFQNCYWLRNPNYFVEGLLEYDENQREVAIRAEKKARVEELKAGCLEATSVQRHFKDPEVAWDAALKLNDGGVGYLTAQLTEVCKPFSKYRQISSQTEKIARDMELELTGFYVSDDFEQREAEKKKAAYEIIDCLENTLQNHRFGAFLSALCVEQDVVQDRLSRVPSSIRISSAVSSVMDRPAISAGPKSLSRPGRPGRPGPSPAVQDVVEDVPAATTPKIRTMTPEQFQADTAIELWVEGLNFFREDERLLETLALTPEAASSLVAELVHGLRRTGVRDAMLEELRAIAYGNTVDQQAAPAAIVCAEAINHFVCELGAQRLLEDARPRIETPDGSIRYAFTPIPAPDKLDGLPESPRASAEETWTDWVYMLETLFVGNAGDTDAGEINQEQNRNLGRILRGLAGDAAGDPA